MLYATGERTRRLLRCGDAVHPQRTRKIWPEPENVPARYQELIEWAKEQYGRESPLRARWLDGIFQLRGIGKELWNAENPDKYVRRLRVGWE